MHRIKKSEHEKVLHINEVFESIIDIQQELISNSEFNSSVDYILKKVLTILVVDRVYIFENHIKENKVLCSQKFEYVKNDITSQKDNPILQNVSYQDIIPKWEDILSSNNIIGSIVKDLPKIEKEILESQNIKSILVLPIFFEKKWWGFIGVDDCSKDRVWSKLEKKVLKIISNSFVAALMEDKYNKSLQNTVNTQLSELRKKDTILIQQSKMAAMGEMIGNIAHQWRQPLNVIGTSLINLRIRYENESLDEKSFDKILDKTDDTLQYMSSTIDNFRGFFIPNKNKVDFDIEKTIIESLDLFGETFRIKDIKIDIKSKESIVLNGYKNELSQTILVLLNNSKDSIVENNIKNGTIDINIEKEEGTVKIEIKDNGGGVKEDAITRIFEPYFTTKFKSQGTGIGLYMAKEIIENHMDGTIEVRNDLNGAIFTIKLKQHKRDTYER